MRGQAQIPEKAEKFPPYQIEKPKADDSKGYLIASLLAIGRAKYSGRSKTKNDKK